MKNKVRLFVYSALAVPFIAAGFLLTSLNQIERQSVLSDFQRNIGRMFSGELGIADLVDAPREEGGQANTWRRGRRDEFDPSALFDRLDKNADGILAGNELGERMWINLGRIDTADQTALTLEEFQNRLQSLWTSYEGQPTATADPMDAADLPPTDSNAVGESNATPLQADELFDPYRVVRIEINMPRNDWQSLCNQSRDSRSALEDPLDKPYTYFKGDITIDGIPIKQVGIRKKGFIGSVDGVRPSLKIKFDEFVDQNPVNGLDRLTLNNNRQDRSLVSQSLTYQLFRQAGVAAPRCSFATLTVNGRYLGIYSHVESIRKPFLAASFGDDSGKLYEGTLSDFYPKSVEWLEAKTDEAQKDRSEVLQMATLLDSSDALSLAKIHEHVNVDNFLSYWAIESLINFWDGYTQNQNNFFAYENPADGRFYFVPWGADSCFGDRPGFSRWGDNYSNAVRAVSILANRLYHVEGVPQLYREALLTILASVWDEQALLAETDRIEKLLFDHIDFRQIGSISASDRLRDFIRERRAQVMEELGDDWPVQVAAEPRTPMYTEEIGSAKGTFSTEWRRDDETSPAGVVSGSMTLHGETIGFDTATAALKSSSSAAWESSDPSPSIVLGGVLDGEPLTLVFLLEDAFLDSELMQKLQVTGVLGDETTFARRGHIVRGEIKPTELGREIGDVVSGEFEVKILEKRGGFMNRRW